jgi:hypothetical protein
MPGGLYCKDGLRIATCAMQVDCKNWAKAGAMGHGGRNGACPPGGQGWRAGLRYGQIADLHLGVTPVMLPHAWVW